MVGRRLHRGHGGRGAPEPRALPDQRGGRRGQEAEGEQQQARGLHGGGRAGAGRPEVARL